MDNEAENLDFEEALAKLDEIVARLEAGELTLEESLTLFEKGQMLAGRCVELLEKAELRVELLTADGEIVDVEIE
ncbi:MAG TPA: exodeoxyribonuclease VII small subunit [Anaerolineae bacterium]|jgi:exodeoxyribonuclease VII small subunit|nr:exodeoxyribonuclease VII small subunit [Anaerolineae bacterium]